MLNWRSKKFLQALLVLGLEKVFEMLAKDDKMGRKLQDAELLIRKRAPKKIFKTKALVQINLDIGK